jgi:hypothetical protein
MFVPEALPLVARLLAVAATGGLAVADAPSATWSAPAYFQPPAPASAAGSREALAAVPAAPLPFVALPPCRLVDTRGNAPLTGGFLPAATVRSYTLAGVCNVPANAQAISLNAAVTDTAGPGFLTLWAKGAVFPPVSTLNFLANQTVANAAVVPLSADGSISVALGVSGADLVLDTNGYYANLSAVTSLNGLAGDLTLAAGSNVSITPGAGALTISATVPQGPAGPAGTPGIAGPQGPTGPQGPAGADAVYTGANWGVIARNTIGAPVAALRAGPFGSFGVADAPPYGIGSLAIEVADGTSKVAFGNEVDFFGADVSALTAVGFSVYTTGENSALGTNMPGIVLEINPNGAGGTAATYASLVFEPGANGPPNKWSAYVDATSTGLWGLTGSAFNSPPTAANCGLNGPRCTFAQIKAFLATGAGAKILSVGVSKGRDFAWQGAIDGLRINGTIYDFEPLGVKAVPAP